MESHRRVSRRQVLGLLTGTIGAATVGRITHATAAQSGTANSNGAIIRTILKDLEPSAIKGHLLFHEHLSFGPAFFERMRPASAPRPATPPPRITFWIRRR